jgi:hypothetical protein
MSSIDADRPEDRRPEPWWRFGMVWFALSGPALVIVAGIATVAIALAHPDPAIVETPAASATVDRAAPTAPALQARNHAATPQRRERP